MNTLSGKKTQITLFLVLLGILILALTALTVLSVIKITETSASIRNEEQILRENESTLAKMELLSIIENELKQSFERLYRMIPEQAHEDQLIAYINRLSEKAGLELLTVEFLEKVVNTDSKPNEMPMSLTFRGGYSQLITLLRSMSTGERLIRVDEVTIANEKADHKNMKINMKAHAFYR